MVDALPLNPIEEEKLALERIGRTPDGRLLHRYLRRVLETVYDFPEDGALRSQNGRRSLARDLMIQLDHDSEATGDGNRTERGNEPILRNPFQPVGQRQHGIRRRVQPDPDVQRWLDGDRGPDTA